MRELVITEDGSHTIYVPELNEHYHSVHGAVQESMHIFIGAGFGSIKSNRIDILEIGFGTGLNALLTLLEAESTGKEVFYTAIEKYPVEKELIARINYTSVARQGSGELFRKMHDAPWSTVNKLTDHFTIKKTEADLTTLPPLPECDLVYFDAFGPDKQPEMWTPEIFQAVAQVMRPGAVFVTYSAKGEVKRNLKAAGLSVELLPGPPGKRQIIRAKKN